MNTKITKIYLITGNLRCSELGKKLSLISGVSAVIAVILAILLAMSGQERIAESQNELDEARQEVDGFVNRAILLCQDQSNSECDQLMMEWFEECKKEDLKMVPSCHDGRITNYLVVNGLL